MNSSPVSTRISELLSYTPLGPKSNFRLLHYVCSVEWSGVLFVNRSVKEDKDNKENEEMYNILIIGN